MNGNRILLAAMTVLAAASCAKEPAFDSADGSAMTLFANTEATKAVLDNFSVKWSAGDKIAVFDNIDTDAHEFTLTGGEGTSSASFTGTPSAGSASFWAASPAAAASAFGEGIVTMTLPSAQTPSGSCDPAALLSVGKAEGSSLTLRNVGAVVRFTISDDDVKKITIEGNNAEKISGSVKVDASTGAVAEIVAGETGVEFTPASGTFAAGTYEIVLLPANLTKGITVTVVNSAEDIKVRSSANALNLARNTIVNLGDVCNGFVFSDNVKSFAYGETLTLNIAAQGISGIEVASMTEGWTADLSQAASGKVSITAPAKGTANPEGAIVLKGTNSKSAVVKTNTLALRLYGINSKADLLAFRAAHGGTEKEYTELAESESYAASIAPYMVDGWVTLNADIEAITGADFVNSYTNFMHHIHEPIDGAGHTINLDVNGVNTAPILAFFQHIDASLKNINFAGQMTQTAQDACVIATLAQQISAAATVENITSSVNLTTDKSNCIIGGILSKGAAAAATLKNSRYSGTITVSKPTNIIGGIVGVQANGKGEYVMTIDGCEFSGKVVYTSTSHNASSRFGGIIGSQERNGMIVNCTNSGEMIFNMDCTQIATASGSGIGGIVGRCNATTSGYTMSTTVKDCAFTGSIVFNNASATQPETYIGKVIGSKLNGYQDAASTGNDESGTITFKYPSAKASFKDASAVLFDFNQSEDAEIVTEDAVSVSVKSAPKGWTVDCTNWASGTITITAPDIEAEDIDRAGFVVLEVEAAGGVKFPAENSKRVRMPGIYDAQDLIDFRAAYGCSTDLHATMKPAGDISTYMIDGEIAITGDITMPAEALYKGDGSAVPYWMMTLVKPLNGNGHTLTINTTHTTRAALIQDVMANVHDLNIAGTMKCTGASAMMGGLCCFISNEDVTISNVKSSVAMTYSGSGTSYIGGLVASQRKYGSTAVKYTVTGCSFDGTIAATTAGKAIGGIFGLGAIGMKGYVRNCSCTGTITVNGGLIEAVGGIYGASGSNTNPGEIVYLDNCSFGGTINYKNPAASGNLRIGGIIGDLARGAELTGCSSTGDIKVDMNGLAFASATNRGVGGIVGRTTAPASSYPNMNAYCKLDGNSFSGTITVSNSVDTEEQNAAGIGQIIGRLTAGTVCDEVDSMKDGTVSITRQ